MKAFLETLATSHMALSAAVLIVVSLAAMTFASHGLSLKIRGPCPLPPGPSGRFLIGNLGQISADHPELDYIRWGKEFDSDVIHTQVLGQHMIVLNSVRAATDLLDKRSSNYSDRPNFTLFEIMGWGRTLTFLSSGPLFKLHRGLFQSSFSPSKVKSFQPIQLAEARKAVRSLLAAPADWKAITLLMSTSIVLRIAFGQEITDEDSPYCEMAQAANEATTAGGTPGSTLVDIFPPARYLPDWLNVSPPLRHARKSRPTIQTIKEVPWNATLKEIENGTASEASFMRTHLENLQQGSGSGGLSGMTDEDIRGAAGAIFIAGGNTTWSTVQSCILFLTKYPDIQKRLQEELDSVLANESRQDKNRRTTHRLPEFSDMRKLPYLERFVQEVLRCIPLNPLVIPHKSIKDDIYRGMFIPGGSTVFANATAMASCPETYRDPEVFDPDRYVRRSSSDTNNSVGEDDDSGGEPYPPGNFGFGRRKCPGNHLALASVHMFLATLLISFSVEKVADEDGNLIDPKVGISVGLGGHPLPFECAFVPRNDTDVAAELFR